VRSQADDLAAGAAKKQAEAQKITASLDNATEQAYADLMKTASEIELNQAKSEQTMASIGDKIMTRMDAMESKMHDRKQEMQPILVNNDMSALAEIMQQGGNQNAGIMKALTDVLDHAMNSEKENIAVRDESGKLSGIKTISRRRQSIE
jgi:galactokinase/mevalonate kinase-like predicted kinase